jgi:uncharacterized protein YndB with AHSA1/START domain
MLKALGIAATVLIVAVGAVAAYAATRPDTFRVQRSLTIDAQPDKIFSLIQDLQGWTAWSPYEKKDPNMKRLHSGARMGKGAVYEWDGDKNVGKGRMEIVDTTPPQKVVIKLDFFSPFEAHNMAEFTMQPQGGGTAVTWAMHGPNLFVGKVIGLFLDMDKMIGNDFADGLKNVKAVAEREPQARTGS